ncbi:MAG: D-glycerate dehydrogenase [Clostridia bacterium]|nr:D-glycerate dehydrogenase [Clostridia bacterium]MBQ4157983.1 D-glycerate dehydrogenase [Clostridia bacterium]
MAVILFTHWVPTEGFEALSEHELLIPGKFSFYSDAELMRLAPKADAIVAGGKLTGKVIEKCGNLKIITSYGAGYDGVDINAARKKNVYVTNIPHTVTNATAELAVGLMLSVLRRIGEMNNRIRIDNSRELFGMGKNMGLSLNGLTLGIIGCGRIGKRVSALARAFGMRVIGYSRSGADPEYFEPCGMDALLASADVISVHCPLTDETRGMIDKKAFESMKKGAVLINTARGAVIDTEALIENLKSGHISGAGLDVYPDEPNIPEELTKFPNAVLTPHIGSNTQDTRREMAMAISGQILAVLNGERPAGIVNGL